MATITKSSRRKPVAPRRNQTVLPLTEVRSRLSPLVRAIGLQHGAVGISVRGEVRAYLVSAEKYEQQQRPRPRPWSLGGSLTLIGSPEEIEKAVKRGREEMLAETVREWDELNHE